MFNTLEARDGAKKNTAMALLRSQVRLGVAQQSDVIQKAMSTVITDRLVMPKALFFQHRDGVNPCVALGESTVAENWYSIHAHAMGQIADVSGITRTYVSRLRSPMPWKQELLDYNLNQLFTHEEFTGRSGAPKRFLVRTVGQEVRGFLSQNFNYRLVTAPLLRTFIEACALHEAGPTEAQSTDVRCFIKCVLPCVFEPIDNEFVAFGVTFSNSDFGAGRLKLSGVVMRISSKTTSVLEDSYSRTHLGSVIQDSDIEMSDDTKLKELETVRGAIKDTVNGILSFETLERNIKAIQIAHEKEIPWYKLKD